ncbi:MAG: DUF3375 domain-containing protein [Planctomycetaceae bacterium]|nr:DUF3375 domain-containing protein [Planctomycetaceae bacterium]
MDVSRLLTYFDLSPAIRLLKANSAPFVVAFLMRRFKESRAITIPHSELLPSLAAFQEEMQESYPEALLDKPETYLTDWCDKHWLRRKVEAAEPVYQLAPATEEVVEFLDLALHREVKFIGTESRLRMIMELLDQLTIGASDDPAVHLERLRQDKARIEQEIERLDRGGGVTPFPPTRIREQFAMAVDELKKLQSDFRGVEEKFKEITQQVQQRQVQGLDSRGGILGQALDSEDALKLEDQGVSFFAFLEFIQSPQQQERLEAIIHTISRLPDLVEQPDGLEVVRHMVPVLLSEAEKVLQTTRRLSATLRRLLDTRAQHERRRIAELLQRIQAFAASMSADPPRDLSLEIDDGLGIASPFSRTNWAPAVEYEVLDLAEKTFEHSHKLEAYRELARLHPIDWIGLRRQIAAIVSRRSQPSIAAVLEDWGAAAGLIDIVGLLEIAREDGHLVAHDATEEIVLPPRENDHRTLVVTVPLVSFVRRED